MRPGRILPLDSELPRRTRRCLHVLVLAMVLCLLAIGARVLAGTGAGVPDTVFTQLLVVVACACGAASMVLRIACVPRQRWVWLGLAAGVTAYAIGAALWSLWLERLEPPPFPSPSDPLWLAIYPLGFVTTMLVLRAQLGRVARTLWMDGIVGALAAAAIVGALVVGPLTQGAEGSTIAVLTNLAYPLGDLLLAGGMVAGCLMTGWRLSPPAVLLAAGFASFGAADVLYLSAVKSGEYQSGLVANLLWTVGVVLLALAPWRVVPRLDGRDAVGRLREAVPSALALAAVGVLVADHVLGLDGVTVALASCAVLVAMARLAGSAREERLLHESRRQAHTDDLTGLANRRALTVGAEAALADAAEGGQAALLLIDLNGFKQLNDTLGHDAGDELLRQVGRRLSGRLHPRDVLARLGGDEFAVLLAGPRGTAGAEIVAERLLAALQRPFPILGLQVRTGASIGIALAPRHGRTPSELLKGADVAMYHAKSARSGVQVYDGTQQAFSPDRLALAGELRRALDDGEIVPWFQPQVDPRTRRLAGVEALARWEHPARGVLGPDAFLSAVEQTNLSRELTLRMVELAAGHAARWAADGLELPVSVNLAAANLMDDAFPADVDEILHARGLPAARLCLEVTEGIVMTDPGRALAVLYRLRELGVSVSLDDFGRDHSSLAYLSRLPVDELKIDRAFIMDLASPRVAAIVRSTCDLARELGLRSIAEGIEDEATLERVGAMGCDAVQGFHVSRPIPGAEVPAWAAAWADRAAGQGPGPPGSVGGPAAASTRGVPTAEG